MDGSSTQHVGGVGEIFQSPEGDRLEYAAHLQFSTPNNEVEYEALIKGLDLAKALGAKSVVVQGDSQLTIGQVNGMCEAKEERLKIFEQSQALHQRLHNDKVPSNSKGRKHRSR